MDRSKLPWAEQFRPRTLDDMVGNEEVLGRVRDWLRTGNLPHLILEGPPGTGKTTLALAIGRAYAGTTGFLEKNASDARGMGDVRGEIYQWASKRMPAATPNKLIFLDEADNMTHNAQLALVDLLRERGTRFILSCNRESRIAAALKSKCTTLHMGSVDRAQVAAYLRRVVKQENARLDARWVGIIASVTRGDCRAALNAAQTLSVLSREGMRLTPELVYHVCNVPSPTTMKQLYTACCAGDHARTISILRELLAEGHSRLSLLAQLEEYMVTAVSVTRNVHVARLRCLWQGRCALRACDTDLQLFACVLTFPVE